MKLIIAGGRDFKNYNLLKTECDKFISGNFSDLDVTIVSGGQMSSDGKNKWGADYFGEQYAIENSYPVIQFLPDWDKFGRSAGVRRNLKMAESADALIAFWDTSSKGTANMIKNALDKKLIVHIVNY